MSKFLLKMSSNATGMDAVVAERITVPKGTNLAWDTTVFFDDGIKGVANIEGVPTELVSGWTLQKCFEREQGRKLTLPERFGNLNVSLYAYRPIIEGCTTGFRMDFIDVETKETKTLCSNWVFSLDVEQNKYSTIIQRVASQEDQKIDIFACSNIFWKGTNLNTYIKSALGRRLKEHSFVEIQSMMDDICAEVLEAMQFSEEDCQKGFVFKSFSLGGIYLAEDLEKQFI